MTSDCAFAALTDDIGGCDSCVQSGSHIDISSPTPPSGYEVKTPMDVCKEMGPFEPGDWNPPA